MRQKKKPLADSVGTGSERLGREPSSSTQSSIFIVGGRRPKRNSPVTIIAERRDFTPTIFKGL